MNAEMLTPAMKYRRNLKELGEDQRVIMRLEYRINKNRQKWVNAAVQVESFARACSARQVASVLRENLRLVQLKMKHVSDALASLRNDRYAEALTTADAALELDSQCVEAFRIRGHTMLRKKQHSEAIVEYSRALEIDSKQLDCRMARARCFGILGQMDSAIKDIESLMDLDPANPEYVPQSSICFTTIRVLNCFV